MVLRDKIMVLRLWVTLKSSSESEKISIRLSGLAIFTVYHNNNPIYCLFLFIYKTIYCLLKKLLIILSTLDFNSLVLSGFVSAYLVLGPSVYGNN